MVFNFRRWVSGALLVGAFSLGGIWSAEAACPARPKIGSHITVSGVITEAHALGITIKGCRIVVMTKDSGWLRKCRTGKQLSATGTYQETPLPFRPVPNVSDIRSLTCGGTKLR
jgi:hypothetical protein